MPDQEWVRVKHGDSTAMVPKADVEANPDAYELVGEKGSAPASSSRKPRGRKPAAAPATEDDIEEVE